MTTNAEGEQFTDLQQMLTLCMIAYLGYFRAGSADDEHLAAKVDAALAALNPVDDRWALVWGPASYRPSISVFDDAMMYVVQDRQNPQRYAIVVRGTNPVSISDWLFGDLWIDKLVPWPWGEGAMISLSTTLGLSILRHLRAAVVGPSTFGLETVFLRAAAELLLDPTHEAIRGPMLKARERVHHLAQKVLPVTAMNAVELVERRAQDEWKELRTVVGDALKSAGARVQFDIYHFLERDLMVQRLAMPGIDLASFLRTVTDDGPAELWVTGHSKGAALASTLALWLADTQGNKVASDEQWDPSGRAVIHCMTFAGPTAGNAAFAAHSDRQIGERCYRVQNEMDMVPHGWLSSGMSTVTEIYGAELPTPAPVAALATSMAKEVENLEYTQIGRHVISFPSELAPGLNFLEQAAYQHVDAYLRWAGLEPYMDRKEIFGF